ncbi:hypothetical protein PYCCODRAFT_1147895 [Trametes coccinea BRFM310]|uniref:Uncharacterized protein n=1 Tax=Trametes coccinea (strain BRFM310) TaxID=1353009 RepID=A0A1Y2I8T8_TRAC3|nr:hypothetical protein PYCCODRAFT_1253476 [Trametes coccinea BRFM310]OSC97251.1 hypothetical protein PYCCODRAFT_1147895 [Trametes coccinea BRFM310]
MLCLSSVHPAFGIACVLGPWNCLPPVGESDGLGPGYGGSLKPACRREGLERAVSAVLPENHVLEAGWIHRVAHRRLLGHGRLGVLRGLRFQSALLLHERPPMTQSGDSAYRLSLVPK